ncbi:LOW QUALITY PROTEIN: mucosa-associated lymphoid tissue lymphoma translocation protein 1-like [Callospermophilus lateralis]
MPCTMLPGQLLGSSHLDLSQGRQTSAWVPERISSSSSPSTETRRCLQPASPLPPATKYILLRLLTAWPGALRAPSPARGTRAAAAPKARVHPRPPQGPRARLPSWALVQPKLLAAAVAALRSSPGWRRLFLLLFLVGGRVAAQPPGLVPISQAAKWAQWRSRRFAASALCIPYGNASELIFNTVHVKDAGFYVCHVNNNLTFEFSQWSQLDVCDVTEVTESFQRSLDSLSESRLQICAEPKSQKLMLGSTLVLQCVAIGSPIPHYQWFKNESSLPHETKKLYMVPYVDLEHEGTNWCHVYNDQDSQDSKKVDVIIDKLTDEAVECTEDELNDFGHPDNKEQTTDQPLAKDKVALLIGNMNYWEHPKLKAPLVDVYELTNLLRQLDFKVVSLLDLTEYEMRNAVDEFLLLVDKGVYGLLYYAGHGYENFGNSFMVPVDAPNPHRSENCLCVQNILKLMQEKETGLNVSLLDMCRKRNDYDDTIPILDALKVTANIVFGYATCQGAEAFEIQHSGLANGIFMKFLKDRLLEDKKITVLLDEVAEDMGKCYHTKGKQALEIRSSLSEKRALTDQIQGTAHSAESLVRNLQWAKAHELPESMCLKFQCGVQIQLGFAAEFSNVMIMYTSIVHKPPEIIMCDAYVTDFPLNLDIDPKDANKGTPEETGSYLVSKDLPKHCLYPRLSSLQKLKEHLIFTVCLAYQYSGLEDTVEEKQEVNFGKPLIAKLDMHGSLGRKTCLPTSLMSDGPFHSSTSTLGGAGHYHSSQDSFHGVYHSHLSNSNSAMPSDRCHCSRTPNAFISNYHTHHYSCHFSRSNVPVETTDEIPFSFSDRLMISEK